MFNHEKFNADLVNDKSLAEVLAQVSSGDINLDMYRGFFKDATKTDSTLTDDELVFMITGTSDELTPAEWVELMQSRVTGDDEELETAAAVTVDRHTANSNARLAEAFATNLDDEFMSTAYDIVLADEKGKRGIAIMLWPKLYGEKAWSKEVWDSIPDLDITEKDAKEKNLNVPLIRWRTKEGNRSRVYDFAEIAITHTKQGAAIRKRIDDLSAAKGTEAKTKEQQALATMSTNELQGELDTEESRLSQLVNRFKRMVRAKRLMDDINEQQPGLVMARLFPKVDKEGNETGLTSSINCFTVQRWGKPDAQGKQHLIKQMDFIPNTFLRLDVEKALEKMKENPDKHFFDALMETKDREPTAGDKDFKVPTSPEKYLSAMNTVLHYTEEASNFEAFQKYYAKQGDADKKLICETLEETHIKSGEFFSFVKRDLEKFRVAEQAERTAKAEATRKAGGIKAA